MTTKPDKEYSPDQRFIEYMESEARKFDAWPASKRAILENSISGTAYFDQLRDREEAKSSLQLKQKAS